MPQEFSNTQVECMHSMIKFSTDDLLIMMIKLKEHEDIEL